MKSECLLTICILGALCSCLSAPARHARAVPVSPNAAEAPLPFTPSPDELDIYDALLVSLSGTDRAAVLGGITSSGSHKRGAKKTALDWKADLGKRGDPEMGDAELFDFASVNERDWLFSADTFQVKTAFDWFLQLYPALCPDKRWDAFGERFAALRGKTAMLLMFSRVGFNPDHTKAAVYVDGEVPETSGMGALFHLSKDQGRWRIDRSVGF